MPSWESDAADKLWTEICGQFRWQESEEEHSKDIGKASDARLWQMRNEARARLVQYAREKVALQMENRGYTQEEIITHTQQLFDPNTLTLGFARRFATYKRPNMLLYDQERLSRLLNSSDRPIQLIIAGKAHPADGAGQAMIKQWVEFTQKSGLSNRVVFLSDYDMYMTQELVRGVDVWINTPRRPWEACGTSGMKVLVNGGLNCSELDGWWIEAYTPQVGWAIGDGNEHGDDPAWDAAEANALYDRLEHEIIPEFYNRPSAAGLPTAWIARVRESLAKLTPRFSASRAVIDYTEKHYLPAALRYQARAAKQGALAQQISDWEESLLHSWDKVSFGELTSDSKNIDVTLNLHDIDPQGVQAQLYAAGAPPEIHIMEWRGRVGTQGNVHAYQVSLNGKRDKKDYTVRLVPHFAGVNVPLEINSILWQH